jgi:hypothetical protein
MEDQQECRLGALLFDARSSGGVLLRFHETAEKVRRLGGLFRPA